MNLFLAFAVGPLAGVIFSPMIRSLLHKLLHLVQK